VGSEHGSAAVRFEKISKRGVIFFALVGGAFLQGYLRFPQDFWVVFCGEFVVDSW
jgi:hypothetical protein